MLLKNYITYSMHGFNIKHQSIYENTLVNNKPHNYPNHYFLDTVFINDSITEITFKLKSGKSLQDYKNEIIMELEKICFNLITYSDLSISQPYCTEKIAVNEDGERTTINFNERIYFHDEIIVNRQISAEEIYSTGLDNRTDFLNYGGVYREVFLILHNPHKVIQFMGLYEIMAGLICNPISQGKVHDFFGKNRNKYPFVDFFVSKKNSTKKEDTFTHLRNSIAHSRQVGVSEYLNIAKSISDTDIKHLLIIINDLLCHNT